MSANRYPLATQLAILQQAEFDLSVWEQWFTVDRDEPTLQQLRALKPERWTLKLKLIRAKAQILSLLVGTHAGIRLAVLLLKPWENLAIWFLVWIAANKLRRLQNNGLTVIGIAGSYGKTSVKHQLFHTLSQTSYTCMTPASYNTPLGIAQTIRRKLTPQHDIFLVELGEYRMGDIHSLLRFVRPDIAVLTPVGYAHLEKMGSEENMRRTFRELFTSPFKPALVLADDNNLELFANEREVLWYGSSDSARARLEKVTTSLQGTQGSLNLDRKSYHLSTSLLGEHQLRNALPGLLLTHLENKDVSLAVRGLRFARPAPRRLEVTKLPNDVTVIDNSYNTNPASWKESAALIRQLKLENVAIITAGFVELDPETTRTEHQKLTNDLLELANSIIIVETANNADLRSELARLTKENNIFFAEVGHAHQASDALAQSHHRIQTLWLEGGSRELYL